MSNSKNGDARGCPPRADDAATAALTLPNLGQKSGISTSATSGNIPEHQVSKNRLFSGLILWPKSIGSGDPEAVKVWPEPMNLQLPQISTNFLDVDSCGSNIGSNPAFLTPSIIVSI
jgi:hypothetical protein